MSKSNLEMEVLFAHELIILGRNKLIGTPFFAPMSPRGAKKGKERDGVSLAFGIAGLSGRPARRAISSVVERAPDNCVVVPGL